MSKKMLYPFFCIQRQWVICGLNVVRIVPHLRRKHKVHQSTQRVWPCVEALQKDEKSFTISFPLYLHFLSSKMKMVKVLLYYLLQLKEENYFKKTWSRFERYCTCILSVLGKTARLLRKWWKSVKHFSQHRIYINAKFYIQAEHLNIQTAT